MKTFLNLSLALLLTATISGAVAADNAAQTKWIEVLNSGADQKEKADACRELAHLGTPEALSALVKLLPDPDLSHMARYAMETMPGSEVDAALRKALESLKGRQLVGVIASLGVRHDEKADRPIAELLSNADPEVAIAAARALGSIGTARAVKSLQQALPGTAGQQQLAICEGLLRAAERADSPRQAQRIYDNLRELTSAPHQVRTAALRGAVLTRGDKGVELLLQALRGSDYSQTAAAARIAQELRAPVVTRALSAELPQLPADKQVLVLQTLGQRADDAALPAIFRVVDTGEKPAQIEALRAATRIAEPSAVPVFLKAMRNNDREVARAAQDSLAAFPGKEADAVVTKMLKSDQQAERLLAMDLVSRRRMKSALPALFDATKSSQPEVRVAAVRKIGELGGVDDMPRLLDYFSAAKEARDVEAAEQALGALCLNSGNPGACVDRLADRLAKSAPAQRAALLRILTAAGGPKALGHVRAAVKDSNTEVRSAAIRALSSWSSAEAAPDLLDLARTSSSPSDKMVSLRGYFGLAKLSEVSAEQRLKMCQEAKPLAQRPEEKRLLLAALGDLNSTQAVAEIEPFLADDTVKEEAATALVGIADRLLRGRTTAAGAAPALVQPLEKAASATANADLAARAKKLLESARSKAQS